MRACPMRMCRYALFRERSLCSSRYPTEYLGYGFSSVGACADVCLQTRGCVCMRMCVRQRCATLGFSKFTAFKSTASRNAETSSEDCDHPRDHALAAQREPRQDEKKNGSNFEIPANVPKVISEEVMVV